MKKLFSKKNPLFMIGIIVFTLIVLGTLIIPECTNEIWRHKDLTRDFEKPSAAHIYGTNEFGQDLFVGIWQGGRTSLLMAIIGIIPYTLIGSSMGIIAGFWGKRIGFFISQLMTFIYAMPLLPLIMMLGFVLYTSGLNESQMVYVTILIYSLFSSPTLFKVIKAETIRLNSEEFMKAATLSGISKIRMIFKHLLPNLTGQILVSAVQFTTQILILEMMLYFFGIAFKPLETPTWGSIIPNLDGPSTFREYYWLWLFPILTVAITTISLKFISEGLRIAFDPKVENTY